MLRIKSPKCATPLAVDDEDAGGVGECTECGIKFRMVLSQPIQFATDQIRFHSEITALL